ncbi:hypothetical protein VPNG_02090 [Cytospora leucostoma]|uniref:Uncharacterized protein n=1 Tax=Cytospora leucostoma TaxID=1230097 RepID=A0A423XHL7_9PEZI|nr:hypothetical protein VPNG_02090 [Cytospora leucostoma]
MSPIQVTPTSAHATGPDPWRIVAIVFITSFILSLLASGAVIFYLNRKRTRLEAIVNGLHRMRAPNPHPFGSNAWRDYELSNIPNSALDALRIADLEAQNNLLGQRAEALEGLVHLCEERNKLLHRQNAELRLESDPVLDEEVMRRVLQELHMPIQRAESNSQGFERQEVAGMDGDSKE